MIKGKQIYLRALEPTDIDLLYQWENDSSVWHLGNTIAPISKLVLKDYLAHAQHDIYSTKQLRLVICTDEQAVGCIDLFDFDPQHLKAGIGILVADLAYRRHGYASEALKLVKEYAREKLNLHQLFCSITVDNTGSIALFEANDFVQSGLMKDWVRIKGQYLDVGFYQCLL